MHSLYHGAYARLPVWAQNAALSVWGRRYRARRLGGRFADEVLAFRDRERWSAERMRDYVACRLREALLRAFSQTTYYREKWSEAGIEAGDLQRLSPEDLSKLPLLARSALRERPESLLAGDAARRRLHWFSTSGSTGSPVKVCRSEGEWQSMTAAREARSLSWAGGTMLAPRAMIGGRDITPGPAPKPPYYRYNAAERQVYFTAFHLRPATVANYVEGLEEHRPRLLTGYAHSYYYLAAMMLDQGRRLSYRPDAIVLSSEALTSDKREAIEAAFGRRPFEEYGSVENCALATECEQGSLHLNLDFGWLEILDEDGVPVPPGRPGRMVCTGLLNEAQPLVRYEIGDVGGFAAQPCSCGRDGLPALLPIEGRLEDTLYGPDGRRVVRLDWIYRDLPQIIEGQVVQERADSFRVKVVSGAALSDASVQALRARVRMRMGEVEVTVERVERIERNRRGKFPAVLSLLPAEEKERLRRMTAM